MLASPGVSSTALPLVDRQPFRDAPPDLELQSNGTSLDRSLGMPAQLMRSISVATWRSGRDNRGLFQLRTIRISSFPGFTTNSAAFHEPFPSTTSVSHEERLAAVARCLLGSGATSVLDLGCGSGDLIATLHAHSQLTRLVGLDIDPQAVAAARATLGVTGCDRDGRISVRCGSFEEPHDSLKGFGAAVMVETIEHVDPGRLSRVEEAVFGFAQPDLVLITTPNQEFNVLHGLAPGERRHWDHRFEWPRARFRQWARGVAGRRGYRARFIDIGPADPLLGSSTQMARFVRLAKASSRPASLTDTETELDRQVVLLYGPPREKERKQSNSRMSLESRRS